MITFEIPNPFETLEEVKDYFNQDKIQCLLCGKYFQNLGLHLNLSHAMPVEEYQDMFNLPRTKGLISRCLCEKFTDGLLKRQANGDTRMTGNTAYLPMATQARLKNPPKIRNYHKQLRRALLNAYSAEITEKAEAKALEILNKAIKEKITTAKASMILGYNKGTVYHATRKNLTLRTLYSLYKQIAPGKKRSKYNV